MGTILGDSLGMAQIPSGALAEEVNPAVADKHCPPTAPRPMPRTALSMSPGLRFSNLDLVLPNTRGRRTCYYPHFIAEDTKVQRQ